ncbi:MAG TPA: Spy/CpxP family protein refolding chaperone [Caulobacteraceae bacterium]|nr:Spy/CpxP family protein refolding chaperone [Caulobacteraceae bacterium]
MIAKTLGALALVAAATLPATVAAQDAPPAAHGHRFGGPDMANRFQEREARRIKALHNVLEIRSDQETAFQAFAAALQRQPAGQPPEAAPPKEDMGALTTPERLDRMAKMMADHEARRRARFDRVSGAVKTLYAALSPEQKRAFDALPALLGPGFGLGGRMGHDGGMMAGRMGWGGRDGGRPMGPPPPPNE